VPTFVDGGVSRGQRGGSPTVVNLSFLDRQRLISMNKYQNKINNHVIKREDGKRIRNSEINKERAQKISEK
jgi:hypothetical protein